MLLEPPPASTGFSAICRAVVGCICCGVGRVARTTRGLILRGHWVLLAEIFLVLDEPDLLLDIHSWIKSERRLPDGVEVGVRQLARTGRHSDLRAISNSAGSSKGESGPVEIDWWLNVVPERTQVVHVLCKLLVQLKGYDVVLRRAGLLLRQRIVVRLHCFFDTLDLQLVLESIDGHQCCHVVLVSIARALGAVEVDLDEDGVE